MKLKDELEILRRAENIVGTDDLIPHTVETNVRLLTLISDGLPKAVNYLVSGEGAICQVIEVPKRSPARNGGQSKKKKD